MRLRFSVIPVLYLLPIICFSQSTGINDLYRYVEETDKLADRSTKTFYLEKFLKDNYTYRETWRYLTNSAKIIYFQIDYILDSTEFTEVYYLDRGRLVCSEEYEKVNYSFREDELRWGGIYYFKSSAPAHVVTIGRRDYARRNMDPGSLVLTRFDKRYSELKRHLPMLPRGY
jgi:hypothetical protein